jgi:hypothetical protein
MFEDIAVGVAAELVTASAGFSFAMAVLLPGVARVVVAVAVELHRQALPGPAAVYAASADRTIGPR